MESNALHSSLSSRVQVVRLSELCQAAGVPRATVRWYLRIGLLHRGTPTAANQAHYDDTHVRRLRLIRVLLEVGGMSVDAARRVLDAIDRTDISVIELLAIAHRALSTTSPRGDRPAELAAVDRFLTSRGWQVRPDSPARRDLAAVLASLSDLGPDFAPPVDTPAAVERLLAPYANAAERIARSEIRSAPADLTREQLVERVISGSVLMERAMAALRRLAHEHYAAQRYGTSR